jgi:hypothetical protein
MAEYKAGTVVGLSSLRATEAPARSAPTEKDRQRAQYLSKYLSGGNGADESSEVRKKKKRKKKKGTGHVQVVDEDVGWPAETGVQDRPTNDANDAGDDDGAPSQPSRTRSAFESSDLCLWYPTMHVFLCRARGRELC